MRPSLLKLWTKAILVVGVGLLASCDREDVAGPDAIRQQSDEGNSIRFALSVSEQLLLSQQLENEWNRVEAAEEKDEPVYDALKSEWERLRRTDGTLNSGLLYCEPQQYRADVRIIGPEGGRLRMGPHELLIPRGALSKYTVITGEAPSSMLVDVDLLPHGLQFQKPVRLTVDYNHCSRTPRNKRVVHVNQDLQILEYQKSWDYYDYEYIYGWLDHFSKYAVATN
jgi:hypothetical protein